MPDLLPDPLDQSTTRRAPTDGGEVEPRSDRGCAAPIDVIRRVPMVLVVGKAIQGHGMARPRMCTTHLYLGATIHPSSKTRGTTYGCYCFYLGSADCRNSTFKERQPAFKVSTPDAST